MQYFSELLAGFDRWTIVAVIYTSFFVWATMHESYRAKLGNTDISLRFWLLRSIGLLIGCVYFMIRLDPFMAIAFLVGSLYEFRVYWRRRKNKRYSR